MNKFFYKGEEYLEAILKLIFVLNHSKKKIFFLMEKFLIDEPLLFGVGGFGH